MAPPPLDNDALGSGETPQVRALGRANARTWEQLEGEAIFGAIFGGDLIDSAWGYGMSAMAWQLAAGARAPVPIPTDEAWILVAGEVAIGDNHREVRAGSATVVLVPRALHATAEALTDTELVTVAKPPSWTLTEADWQAMADVPPPGGHLETIDVRDLDGPANDRTGVWSAPLTMEGFGLEVQVAGLTAHAILSTGVPDRDEAIVVMAGSLRASTGTVELEAVAGTLLYRPAGHHIELTATESTRVAVVRPRG